MKFNELIEGCRDLLVDDASVIDALGDKEILELENDSRRARAGSIFFAIKGFTVDGTNFIGAAHQSGCEIAICATDAEVDPEVAQQMTILHSTDVMMSLGQMLRNFNKDFIPPHLLAVTGTCGKTSTAEFIRQMFSLLGFKSASLGSLGMLCSIAPHEVEADDVQGIMLGAPLTTPDICDIYRALHYMVKERGVEYVSMETASQGLHQHRLNGLKFDAGTFTNLSSEHLDYHKTMDEYFDAKMIMLREYIDAGRPIIVNADIERYPNVCAVAAEQHQKIYDFGRQAKFLKVLDVELHDQHQDIKYLYDGKEYMAHLNLLGDFQVDNVSGMLANLLALGFKMDDLLPFVPQLRSAKGRIDLAGIHPFNNAKFYVDFAHKPEALEKTLKSMRKVCPADGRLVILFGCGGDRDPSKRPMMGKIAHDLADVVIVTDDNPRTEDPASIRKAVMAECPGCIEIDGRKEAVEYIVRNAHKNDIVVLAGKGNENYQILGKVKHHLDEFEVIADTIEQIKQEGK